MALPARFRRDLLSARVLCGAFSLLLVVGAGAGPALAGGDFLSRERPTRTRSTVAVFPRELVLEAGGLLEREGARELFSLGELALRYGVFESIELRLDLASWVRVEDPAGAREGLADPSLAAKLELRDYSSGWIPESALVVGTRLALGDADVGADRDGVFGLVALSWQLAPSLSLTANAGVARPDSGRGRFTQAIASAALAWPASSTTTYYAELFALSEDPARADASLRVGLGTSYLLGESLALDFRIERGSSGADPDYLLGAGISARF